MKILWMNTQLFSEVCKARGYPCGADSSWGYAALRQLKSVDGDIQATVMYCDRRPCDLFLDGVRHVSYQADEYYYYDKIPESLIARIKRLIQEEKPDVIHIHGTETFYGALPIDAYCGVPVIVTILGLINGCHPFYTGNLMPDDIGGVRFNAGFLRHFATPFSSQRFWREKRARQEQRTITQHRYFIGRTEWDEACVRFYNPEANYFKVNETLRAPFFNIKRDQRLVAPHSIFCSAAANYPLKGVHWLMRAVSRLKDEFPDIQLRIADAADKIGTGIGWRQEFYGSAYSAYLRKLIQELKIEDNVVALPRLNADSVAEELRHAQLFVLPSLVENSSNSLGEAMLAEVPSIATYVGGTPSIIRDGIDGKLVPPSDPFMLAKAIGNWFKNPQLAGTCAQSARSVALRRHDPNANARDLLEVYRKVISDSKK